MPLNIPIVTTEKTSKTMLPIEEVTVKNESKKTKTALEKNDI